MKDTIDKVQTLTRTFAHYNILAIKAGTNTPHGGDAGHGGVTVFELVDAGGTNWQLIAVDSNGKEKSLWNPKGIRIELYGDAEAETFLKALDFAVKTLKLQRGEL